ncbi:unnamed protein product, partial [Porites evermanni]
LKRSHKELYYDTVLKLSFLYGSSVWSSTNKVNLDKDPDSHIKKNRCALIHKKLKGNTANYMNEIELLVINSSLYMRNTRFVI